MILTKHDTRPQSASDISQPFKIDLRLTNSVIFKIDEMDYFIHPALVIDAKKHHFRIMLHDFTFLAINQSTLLNSPYVMAQIREFKSRPQNFSQQVQRGIGTKVPTKYGLLRLQTPQNCYFKTIRSIISEEIRRCYDQDIFENIGLKTVYLTGSIDLDNDEYPALAVFPGTTLQLKDQYINGTILINIDYFTLSTEHVMHLCSTLHHEIFHLMQNKFKHDNIEIDPWPQSEERGNFVSEYAMISFEEDCAETFASMLMRPEAVIFQQKTSKILQNKVAAIVKFLKSSRLINSVQADVCAIIHVE